MGCCVLVVFHVQHAECYVPCCDVTCCAVLMQVATAGLLNIIGAPHLAIDSTYAATYSTSNTAELLRKNSTSTSGTNTNSLHSPGTLVLPDSKAVVQQAVQVLIAAGFAPKPINPTDYWSSGWPRLNPEPKLTDRPEEAGLQLPL